VVHAVNKVTLSHSTSDFGKAQSAGNGPALCKGCNVVQNCLCCGPSGASERARPRVVFLAKDRAISGETRLGSHPHRRSECDLIYRMDHKLRRRVFLPLLPTSPIFFAGVGQFSVCKHCSLGAAAALNRLNIITCPPDSYCQSVLDRFCQRHEQLRHCDPLPGQNILSGNKGRPD
jgi:hypothetical protein